MKRQSRAGGAVQELSLGLFLLMAFGVSSSELPALLLGVQGIFLLASTNNEYGVQGFLKPQGLNCPLIFLVNGQVSNKGQGVCVQVGLNPPA